MEPRDYERPTVVDYGDLVTMTAGCIGTGAPDAAFPADAAFPDNSPAFGDPGFCT
jgi:hypothetical protein